MCCVVLRIEGQSRITELHVWNGKPVHPTQILYRGSGPKYLNVIHRTIPENSARIYYIIFVAHVTDTHYHMQTLKMYTAVNVCTYSIPQQSLDSSFI